MAEVVLIDSPPLLPVTDAAILATLSDGAILVTRHGHTTTEQVRQALMNLEQDGGRLLGTVLTMTPTKGPDAYRYGYGDGYGDGDRPAMPSPNGSSGASVAATADGPSRQDQAESPRA